MRWLAFWLVVLLTGCASSDIVRGRLHYGLADAPEGERLTWPPAPEVPRYAYAGTLVGEPNFRRDDDAPSALARLGRWIAGLDGPGQPPRVLQRPGALVGDDAGRLYVADTSRQAVFVFDEKAGELQLWEQADRLRRFVAPAGVAVGAGRVFVSDAELGAVFVLGTDGAPQATWGAGRLQRPTGLARDPVSGRLYVADTSAHDIKVFDANGTLLRTLGRRGTGDGEFNYPSHLAWAAGELYVTDTMNHRVQVFDGEGRLRRAPLGKPGAVVGNFVRPKGVGVDGEGNVYVVESYHDSLLVFSAAGEFLLPIGGTGTATGRFYLPAGVWVDGRNRVHVADMFNGRIVLFQFLGRVMGERLFTFALGLLLAIALPVPLADAQRISDVRGTKHNLSVNGPGSTHAAPGGTSEVCVFCHTPHNATQADQGGVTLRAPLWNRRVPAGTTYTPYASSTMDAQAIVDGFDGQPGGSSKLCLSCHDGTLAIGNVNVLNGQANASIPMTGTGAGGVMPAGQGTASGFTRFLGTDLRNDHPISVTFTTALAQRDGELRTVDAQQRWPAGSGIVIGPRAPGFKPLAPLERTGAGGQAQVQCATCHDPHLRELDAAKGNQKFLRLPRFQEAAPTAGHNAASDIVCLACHDKNGSFGIWAYSAHAQPAVADETYRDAAAQLREFPTGLPVWKAACLNCHDTHTVQGARRLTREGTDAPVPPGNLLAARQGGNPALENTCYQCHTTAAKSVLASVLQVPDIETPFSMAVRMPITTAEQGGTAEEVHDPSSNFVDASHNCTTATNRCGADGIEPRATLAQRHAECTDCHNPHRVVRNRQFNADPTVPDAAGTHRHDETTGYIHSNIASGVLRGSWGVEPVYGSTSFQSLPGGYTVKRGDPGANTSTAVTETYVTREYQVCLKCHSDFAYTDNNVYPSGSRPALGRTGGTLPGSNNLTVYTNQAKEFQAPLSHQGEGTKAGSGAGSNYAVNNHRGWHPVMGPTGRSAPSASAFRAPWGNAIGTQTMYCSDCHGENTPEGTVVPTGGEQGAAWGPHGSNNNFLLKGQWNTSVGADNRGDNGPNANGLCFKCHNPNTYANRNGTGTTGYFNADRGNLHAYHTDKIGRIRCNWCHVAVPHGWKNKALLVNLNDVGEEAGQPAGGNREWRMNAPGQAFNQEPYYLNSKLKVRTFATSGNWVDTNCGSNNSAQTFGTNGNSTLNGKDWMKDVCSNPP